MKEASLTPEWRKLASLAIIPVALILIALFTVLDIRTATEPPFLLSILNTVFIGVIPLIIATIAFRSYRSGGSAGLFMMGSGMMIFGLGSIAAGWLIGLPQGTNISVAIYNVCIFISAVFYLTGALLTILRSKTPETAGYSWKIAAMSAGIIVFVVTFIVLVIAESIPPFFIAGSGPTVLRQVILSNAVIILAIASILLFHVYRQKREDFFFWYAVSLAVIAVGLVAALFIPALGSPVNWISRVMQYIGAGFALVAIIVAGRLARGRGHSLEETLSRFFSDAEAGYKSLIETATDAIVVSDSNDRILVWNAAAEMMFGYSSSEAVGSNFTQLAVPDESAGLIKNNFRSNGISGEGSAVPKPVKISVRHKDGSTFPAEFTFSRHVAGGTEVSTCIIRDITERKKAEDSLRQLVTRLDLERGQLEAVIENLEEAVGIWSADGNLVAINNATLKLYGFETKEAMLKHLSGYADISVRTLDGRELPQEDWPPSRALRGETFSGWELEQFIPSLNKRFIGSNSGSPVRDADGRIVLAVNTVQDITERKRSEKALQESESILQSFFNVLGAMRGIVEVIADDDVRHLMDNVITAGFIGRTPEALKNMRGSEIGEPRDILRIWVSHYRESQRSGSPVSFEYRDKRGEHEAWLQATVSYLGTPGEYPRFAYVVTDITGYKEAEEKLRYHASLVETISDAVISTDTRLTILSWNKAAETVYGWRPDEVLGKSGSEILKTEFPPGTDRETITRDLFEKGIWHGELIQRTKGGDVITVEATSMRLNDETGRTIGAVSVSRNITERKRAEEALAFQARLLSDVQDAVFSSDSSYSITYWNQAAEKMFGWTKEEALGKSSGELLKPKVTDSSRDQERSKLRSAGHWEGEVQYTRKDGTVLLVEVNSTVLGDPEGKDIGTVVVARDITDRKQAEDALRESEEKFRVLTQNLQSAVALIDEHGAFSIVNSSFLRMFGIPADADILNVNNQDWARWQVFNEDGTQLDVDQHPVRKAALTGRAVKNQLVAMKSPSVPDLKWLLISAEPIQDAHGGIHRIICTYYDITDRRKAEEELRQSEERFRLALRNAPVSVALQDTNLIYRWAYNQKTRQTDEIVGKTDANLFAAEDVAWLTPLKHRILKDGDDVHTENWLTSNGQRIYLDLYFEPLRNKNGEITGIGIAAVDLTDLKLAKDELQKKNDTLNALNEELSSAEEELNQNVEELSQREEALSKALAEKDILLSEIHHRVKNNLAAFISLLGLEGSHEESPTGKSLKKDLQNRARSMALIHETLYNTHRYSEVDMEIYLSTLIGQVVNSYGSAQSVRTVIEAKGVTLDLARATPTGLIVNELVTNSLKYAFPPEFDCIALRKEPCTIRVSLVREDGTHLLTVSDNGRGLPAEIDPFATKSLGLKLVNFLAGHQLRAMIEIRTDKGTEFIFRLNKREDYP